MKRCKRTVAPERLRPPRLRKFRPSLSRAFRKPEPRTPVAPSRPAEVPVAPGDPECQPRQSTFCYKRPASVRLRSRVAICPSGLRISVLADTIRAPKAARLRRCDDHHRGTRASQATQPPQSRQELSQDTSSSLLPPRHASTGSGSTPHCPRTSAVAGRSRWLERTAAIMPLSRPICPRARGSPARRGTAARKDCFACCSRSRLTAFAPHDPLAVPSRVACPSRTAEHQASGHSGMLSLSVV